MLTKSVNLTYLYVLKEIHYVVESEEYRGNLILQDSDCKQQLIEYVLSNLNHRYMMIELTEIPKEASGLFPQCSLEERVVIRQLLLRGMSKIVRSLYKEAEKSPIGISTVKKQSDRSAKIETTEHRY